MVYDSIPRTWIDIVPIFHRHGKYYDRKLGKAWIESRHGSWEIPVEDFMFDFDVKNHIRPARKVIDAISTLINYKCCPKDLKDWIRKEELVRSLRDVHQRSLGHRIRCIGR